MKLSELLDKESLASVHDRTNISIEILLKLLDNDFEELTRVRSLGFVSILKREYDVELKELESAIKEYFKEHIIDDSTPVLVTVDRGKGENGFLKWFIIIALLGGLWYLYSSGQLDGNLSNTYVKESTLNDSEALEHSVNKDNNQDSVIVTKDENSTRVEIQTEETPPIVEENITQNSELNSSENKIENNSTKKEKESKKKEPKEKESKEIESKKESKDKDNSSDDIEKSLDESIKEAVKTEEKSAEITDNTIVDEDDIAKIIYNVTVNPRVNLWFGYINIETQRHKEHMTTKSTSIDVGEQKLILMTGHGRLSLSSDIGTVEVNDKRKHYFYIDSSKIKEIDRAEFKSLNGGKGW